MAGSQVGADVGEGFLLRAGERVGQASGLFGQPFLGGLEDAGLDLLPGALLAHDAQLQEEDFVKGQTPAAQVEHVLAVGEVALVQGCAEVEQLEG